MGDPRLHYRLILLDLDATLLNDALEITPRVAEAIAAVRARGVAVALASARPPRALVRYHRQLGLETPLIAYNGALVYDLVAGEALYHRPIPIAAARQVVEALRVVAHGLNISLECADLWYIDTLTDEIRAAVTRFGVPPPHGVACLAEVLAHDTTTVSKLFFVAEPEAMSVLLDRLEADVRRKVWITLSGGAWHDVVRAGVSKGTALHWLARRYGLAPAQVLAIGDSASDAPMLRAAGLGVAVANADTAARAAADVLVASHNENGVAEALERFVLQR